MITIAVKKIGKCHNPAVRCHSREQPLVLTGDRGFIITAHFIEYFAAKHCRTVRKRKVTGTTHESPAITRTHFASGGINSIAERANYNDIRTALNDLPLPSQPIRMSDVVGVHARHDRSMRIRDDGV